MRDNIISIEAWVGLLGLIADRGFAGAWENFDNRTKLTAFHKINGRESSDSFK
jgi:hypothetical protein